MSTGDTAWIIILTIFACALLLLYILALNRIEKLEIDKKQLEEDVARREAELVALSDRNFDLRKRASSGIIPHYFDKDGNRLDLGDLPMKGNVAFTRMEVMSGEYEWRMQYFLQQLKRVADENATSKVTLYRPGDDHFFGTFTVLWEITPA